MRTVPLLFLLLPLALTGCAKAKWLDVRNLSFIHKVDVQQGNVVTQDMLALLRPGMEKNKVTFIMGSPLLVDTFHPERWDYIYTFQKGNQPRERRLVTLHFVDERLAYISGNVYTGDGPLPLPVRRDTTVEVTGKREETLLGKLKSTFSSDEADIEATAAKVEAELAGKKPPEQVGEAAGESQAQSGDSAAPSGENASTVTREESFFDRLLGVPDPDQPAEPPGSL